MSTGINIKKKLAILDEGASVTTDATSIDFVGSGVNSSTVGGNVTVTIPGGSGNTTYYLNQSVTQTPYKEFSSLATSAAEQVVPLTVAGGVTSVIAEFLTPAGVPGTTQIPGGLWQLFLHFNASTAGQNWIIRPTVYKRDLSGTETLLFTSDPEIVTGMSTVTTMYISDGVFPATTLLTTDRIVVKISVENTTGVSQTVNFRTEGTQHYSVALTTLNQVIPTGAVTSVTGTAPIASSGGTTPAISIAQATGSTDGYLSSSDWSVFDGKQDAITLTTTGTSGAATLIGSTLNIPNYATSSSGIWGIANASGVYTYYATYQLAVASATAGQTIELFTEISETTNSYILKDGVNINGNGHTITFTNTGHSVTDNAIAVSCSIYDLTIVRTDSTYYGLYIDNNSSKINGNNSLNIKNANTSGKGIYLDGECFGVNVECANSVLGNQPTSNLYNFSVKSFGTGFGVYFSNYGYCSNGVIESTSTADNALSGALYGSNLKIKSNGFRAVGLTGGNITNSYIKSLTSLGVVTSGFKISNCYIESNGGYAVDGGEYENCTIVSTTSLAVRCNVTYLYNCKVTTLLNACCGAPNNSLYAYSTTFQCKWNNASGHGTNSLVASTIVDCNFIITNASAYAIYSDNVTSVVMYGNKIKGTTNFKNANITQSQTNTADAQGNIILN
jgi:hypothetical protein